MLMKNKIMQIFWSLKNLLKHVIIQRKLLLFVLTIFSFFDFFLINNAVLYSWIHSTPTQWTSDIHRHIKIWNKLYKASFVLKSIRASRPFLTQIIIAGSCLQGMCNVFKSYENWLSDNLKNLKSRKEKYTKFLNWHIIIFHSVKLTGTKTFLKDIY